MNLAGLGQAPFSETLSEFTFRLLRQDGVLAHFRGRHVRQPLAILMTMAASDSVTPGAALQLNNEFALRERLSPLWAVTPIASVWRHGSLALLYHDGGAEPLDQRLVRAVDTDSFLSLAIGITGALRAAHEAGLIHNNIKPSNILVDPDGVCRLGGFGIASVAGLALQNGAGAGAARAPVEGTPAYMSPEQSGRTRRAADARSDLYSLGVTLYELLTGRLPFEVSDASAASEWFHAHLASEPAAPRVLAPGVPDMLSRIVLKLLAKSPEQRYQSAAGLEGDLKRCRLAWQASGDIVRFPLGLRDQATALVFPDRLYGRDGAIQTLGAAFEHMRSEQTQTLAVISGPSGSGKSALLQYLQADPRLRLAWLAIAKVDQYRRAAPHAVLAEAVRGLVLCILGQDDLELDLWRRRLLAGLGGDAALALQLVPELEMLVGQQHAGDASDDSGMAAARAVLQRLVRIFASGGRPLVLMLDDVQWLDAASMELLESLLGAEEPLPLMLIVTCRDSDVDGEPVLSRALSLLRTRGARLCEARLPPLDLAQLERLVADTLRTGRRQIAALAALIHEKTAGCPSHVKQFIKSIVDEGLIVRAARDGKWYCHLDAIAARSQTANVIDQVMLRLARLPADTRLMLGALACVGPAGTPKLLGAIYDFSPAAVDALLAPALEQGVLAQHDGAPAFAHERLRLSVCGALSCRERRHVHLRAGQLMAQQAGADSAMLREALQQLLQVKPELSTMLDAAECLHYAGLALLAARQARARWAWQEALACLALARGLLDALPASGHGAAGDTAFEVMLEQANCEFFSGRLDAASALVAQLLRQHSGKLARSQVALLKVEIHLRRCEYQLAVATALHALQAFGIVLAPHPPALEAEQAGRAMQVRLAAAGETALLSLPRLAAPETAAAMALLGALLAPASFTDTNLHMLQLCEVLNLTLEHGVDGTSAVALAWFGVLVGHRYGDHAAGFEHGLLARALVSRNGFSAHEAPVLLALDQLSVWTQPLGWSLDCAREGYATARRHGDLTTACFECCHQICLLLVRGDHLDVVAGEIDRALDFARQSDFQDVVAILLVQQQFVDTLRRAPGGGFSAERLMALRQSLPAQRGEDMSTARFWRHLYSGITHFVAGEHGAAAFELGMAGRLAWSAPGHIHLLDYHLFSALNLAATAGDHAAAAIAPHGAKIAAWAALNPASFADKHALVQGELRRLAGDDLAALRCYEQAIEHAQAHGYDQYAALAHELAAALSARLGHAVAAQTYLKGAREAWLRWGARGKAQQLERLHPQLSRSGQSGLPNQDTVSIVETAEIRDIDSVIRSARALSEEIVVDRLVHTLMKIALEHAGAQRGLLIRMHGQEPFIEACALTGPAGIDVKLAPARTVPGLDDLPTSMLYTVMRTRRHVSVGDGARLAPFSFDPYLQQYADCAAICIPMLKQAQLVGVLYLENRLAPNPFTAEQAKVLVLLAAQAAVSLETARLYAELLEENEQRRRIEKALRDSKATLLLGEQISHSGSWTWDVGSGALLCSAEFCRIFGFDPEQPLLPFMTFLEAIHPDDRERVRRHVNSCVADRDTIRVEYRVLRPDASLRYVSAVGKPVADELEADTYVGTATDITARRVAEDNLRAAQADLARVARVTTVGQLTASIAHEVNQPLMSIASNAGASLRWLERSPPQLDQVREGLLDIASQSRRAGNMIQSLQALTRRAPALLEAVDLHATIRHILSISRSELERSGVALELSLLAGEHAIMGDGVQLQQVLLNLVINAVEAMSDTEYGAEYGNGTRVLSISSTSSDDGMITVRVDDTGYGLGNDAAQHIFEPFYSTKKHGMGMGLAICRSIIEAHRGTVRAEPRQPRGCGFVFVLPAYRAG